MQDAIEKFAADVKATVKETAAKVAEIYRIPHAVSDIAAKIREL